MINTWYRWRLRRWHKKHPYRPVYAKDFGVRGDGVTNCTIGLQAALDTAAWLEQMDTKVRRTVILGSGVHRVNSPINLSAHTDLKGDKP